MPFKFQFLNDQQNPLGLWYTVRLPARSDIRVNKAKGALLLNGSTFLCPMRFASR